MNWRCRNHSHWPRSVCPWCTQSTWGVVPSAEGVFPPKESRDAVAAALRLDLKRYPAGLQLKTQPTLVEHLRFTACANYGKEWTKDKTADLLRRAADEIERLERIIQNGGNP